MEAKTTPMKGYECYYSVSMDGRIFRVNEEREFINGKIVFKPLFKEMKTHKHPDGYLDINLCVDGKQKRRLVHRLIAQTFIPNPNNYDQINHKDGDRSNNKLDNLEWCNNSMNQKHRIYVLKNHNTLGKFGGDAPKAISINQIDPLTNQIVKTWPSMVDAIKARACTNNVCRCWKDPKALSKGFRWEKCEKK